MAGPTESDRADAQAGAAAASAAVRSGWCSACRAWGFDADDACWACPCGSRGSTSGGTTAPLVPSRCRNRRPGLSWGGGFTFESLEPTLGFEPRTCCLRNSCSTAELCRRGAECTSPSSASRPRHLRQRSAGSGPASRSRARRSTGAGTHRSRLARAPTFLEGEVDVLATAGRREPRLDIHDRIVASLDPVDFVGTVRREDGCRGSLDDFDRIGEVGAQRIHRGRDHRFGASDPARGFSAAPGLHSLVAGRRAVSRSVSRPGRRRPDCEEPSATATSGAPRPRSRRSWGMRVQESARRQRPSRVASSSFAPLARAPAMRSRREYSSSSPTPRHSSSPPVCAQRPSIGRIRQWGRQVR